MTRYICIILNGKGRVRENRKSIPATVSDAKKIREIGGVVYLCYLVFCQKNLRTDKLTVFQGKSTENTGL